MEENDSDWLARRFEDHRSHLRAVAYRMLGSTSEANDAVQEAWLRLSRTDASAIDNMGGWLTTVVGRVCLNRLRFRRSRREEPLDGLDPLDPQSVHVPDPIVGRPDAADPEQSAVLADSVGIALLVVLETLAPAERLAFVLHDLFAVPFDEIARMIDRSPAAARQLASRARRRVQGAAPAPDTDLAHQREVVDAFFAAARDGDFDALVAVLDPDVVARTDGGPGASTIIRGAAAVAAGARSYSHRAPFVRPAIVNGAAGAVVAPAGRPVLIMAFTVRDGKIVAIDALADRDRLRRLDLSAVLEGES
jgi:RNA polymerase sigma-70 factor (ECF subfamily)